MTQLGTDVSSEWRSFRDFDRKQRAQFPAGLKVGFAGRAGDADGRADRTPLQARGD